MNTRTRLATLAITCALAAPLPAVAQDAARQGDAGLRSDLILSELSRMSAVPGLGASVWRDGRVVWTGTAGMADAEVGRPVTPETIFRLGSVSKMITALAAWRLSEQGRLDLDAPVATVVPWLPHGRWPDINARQLAAHTSGLPHYQAADSELGATAYGSIREAVALFQDRNLLRPPGEAYSYSSWGYVLLSAEVEAAAGRPFLDYLAAEITPGLAIGADSRGADPRASTLYGMTQGRAGRITATDLSYTWAGGGLAASPTDVARWGGRVLDGEIVNRDAFERMLVPARLKDGAPAGEGDTVVGFGWRIARDEDGRRLAQHAGAVVGGRAALVLYPDDRTAAAIGSNALWVSAIETTARMLAAPFLDEAAAAALPHTPCPVGASRYSGQWKDRAVSGAARFSIRDGVCTGTLEAAPGNAFADEANDWPQGDSDVLTVIGVAPGDGLSRAALVTPSGAYDLRPSGEGWSAAIGSTRTLTFRLD